MNRPTQPQRGLDLFISNNSLMAIGGVAILLLLVLLIILVGVCLRRRGRSSKPRYTAGKRTSADPKAPPDLWINQPNGSGGQLLRNAGLLLDLEMLNMGSKFNFRVCGRESGGVDARPETARHPCRLSAAALPGAVWLVHEFSC